MTASATAAAQGTRMICITGPCEIKKGVFYDYVVQLSAEDLLLAEKMFRVYVDMLDAFKAKDTVYKSYHRKKFLAVADRLSVLADSSVDEVYCSYTDLIWVISMFRDNPVWARAVDPVPQDRFRQIADSVSSQIGYDYDAQLEKCRKKHALADDDVGADAMELMVKAKKKKKEDKEGEKDDKGGT